MEAIDRVVSSMTIAVEARATRMAAATILCAF